MALDIRRPLKKFLPHLLQAKNDNLNEADTVMRVIKVFEDVLGYSAMSEITRESNIKDKYVDLAIKTEGRIRLLVEVKSAGISLRDRHIEQAERYAAEGNHRWVVLTNGTAWNLYHLTFEEGIEYERVFTIDLGDPDGFDKSCECLSLLHRSSVRKDEHEEHWKHRLALSADSIGKSLFNEDVLRLIRRDIRQREGLRVDEEDLAAAIHEMFSPDARERIGPMRIRRRRKPAAKRPVTAARSDQGSGDRARVKPRRDGKRANLARFTSWETRAVTTWRCVGIKAPHSASQMRRTLGSPSMSGSARTNMEALTSPGRVTTVNVTGRQPAHQSNTGEHFPELRSRVRVRIRRLNDPGEHKVAYVRTLK